MPTINSACNAAFLSLSHFPRARVRVRVCMCDLCRLADINIERMHRCWCTMRSLFLSHVLTPRHVGPSRSSPAPHFRATRSVLLSSQPPAFSLLTFSFSLSSAGAFSLFPSHSAHGPPFPHSRHPIPDTRYLIMLNASGFCGRIMRPRCPRTLFRSHWTAFSLSLSLSCQCSTITPFSRFPASRAEKEFAATIGCAGCDW